MRETPATTPEAMSASTSTLVSIPAGFDCSQAGSSRTGATENTRAPSSNHRHCK
jgi:hypothetical protein